MANFDMYSGIAGAFAVVAIGLSFYEIIQHMCNYTKPYLQRYVIRILLMVPIYTMNAWIAMVLPVSGLYLDSFREVYESFVIYSFMKYLLNFLHYDTNLQQYIDHKPGPRNIFPFCLLPNCTGGRIFMARCKHGILQYVVVRPITSLVAFMSQLLNIYGEGNYNPLSGYTYPVLLIINNASQVLAMYCIVIFYAGYHQELKPMSPLTKFLSIKLVVFFSFFQSVIIAGLLEVEMIEGTLRELFPELDSKLAIGRKLQEFLICFDMLIAAVGHLFAFTYKPFTDDDELQILDRNSTTSRPRSRGSFAKDPRSCCNALNNIFDFSDEKMDVSEHFSQIVQRVRQMFSFSQPLPTVVSSSSINPMNDIWMNQTSLPNEPARTNELDGLHMDSVLTAEISSAASSKNYQSLE